MRLFPLVDSSPSIFFDQRDPHIGEQEMGYVRGDSISTGVGWGLWGGGGRTVGGGGGGLGVGWGGWWCGWVGLGGGLGV